MTVRAVGLFIPASPQTWVMCCVKAALTAVTAQGSKNFSASSKSYRTTVIYAVCRWSKCHYVVHDWMDISPVQMTCKNLTTFYFPINILIVFNVSSTFILNHIKRCYNFCFKHQTSLKKFEIRRKTYCYYPYFYFFHCSCPLPNVLRFLILPFSFRLGNFLLTILLWWSADDKFSLFPLLW